MGFFGIINNYPFNMDRTVVCLVWLVLFFHPFWGETVKDVYTLYSNVPSHDS